MSMLPLLMLALAVPAKLSSVVVYSDRAQVSRVETVPCAGRALAVFDDLPPAADPATFRARAEGASVESLVVDEHASRESFASEREALRVKREGLERELTTLADARARAQGQGQLGERLVGVAAARVKQELTEPRPDTRAWTQAFTAALDTRLRAVGELQAQVARRGELERELETVLARDAFLFTASERLARRVEVRLACGAGGQARVELRYMVGGAGWAPFYEARADEAAGQVVLSTSANVWQTTGEEWNGVALSLSTARPRANAEPPELVPLTLKAWERRSERKVLVRRDERQEHAEAAAAQQARTEGAARAVSQGVSVQLQVPEPARVGGDGVMVRLRVARTTLAATFLWRAVPKLRPEVFRVARLVNGAPFPLVPGSVDVFRASGFQGSLELEQVPQGAPFQLTFGVEEALRVERGVVREIARDEGLFGGRRRFRYAYRLDLANYRPGPEEVEVMEHLPVSELEDVKVELEQGTTPGHVLDAAEGFVTWRVKLDPTERRSVDIAFHVDVPSSYDTGAL